MSGKPLVGWQILHKLIENDIKSEKDVIIAVTHWFLIKEGGFLCLGTGDKVCSTFRHFRQTFEAGSLLYVSLYRKHSMLMKRAANFYQRTGIFRTMAHIRCAMCTMMLYMFCL